LHGIIPPLVTPFTARGDIDEEALRSELVYMLEAGVHGITVTGSTGEGHTLSIEESCLVARIAIEEVAGRVPVISGIIGDSTREVIEYGRALKDEGVDALQITPVHYLFTPGEEGTLRYYADIGGAVRLPIVIYNVVPWNTISVSTLMKLGEQQWIIGVKQSGGDIHKLADLLREVRSSGSVLRILSAIDALLFPSFVMGAHGAIAALLTVLPHQSVALWNACSSGDMERARQLHERMLPVWRLVEASGDMNSRIKAGLEVQGRRGGVARAPLLPVRSEVYSELRAAINASGERDASLAVGN
jgi:4-hydroxy-tetrahydrodipicolinate synthase